MDLSHLAKYIRVIGHEPALMERAEQAVHFVASTPEGMALLEKAERLHGKPLELFAHSHLEGSCYGYEFEHRIDMCPAQYDQPLFYDHQLQPLKATPEQILAHELEHAGQDGIQGHADAYFLRKAEIQAACDEAFQTRVKGPVADYMKKTNSALTEAAIKGDRATVERIVTELFDVHIASAQKEEAAVGLKNALADPVLKHFYETYEKPAIQAENAVMAHKGQSPRLESYLESTNQELVVGQERSEFIHNMTEGMLEAGKTRKPKSSASSYSGGGGYSGSYSGSSSSASVAKTAEPKSWVDELSGGEKTALIAGTTGLGATLLYAANKKKHHAQLHAQNGAQK